VTNAVSTVARLTHTSSGTVAAGFGVGLEAELENAAGINKVVGAIAWDFTAAASGKSKSRMEVLIAEATPAGVGEIAD
jgi:hypothetical protein